jgi:endoribonuclease Dicer
MEQINLLIFDEAHHTKKNHVYARYILLSLFVVCTDKKYRIIRDSYLQVEPSKQPRIFGMTASPVDTKDDPVEGGMYAVKHFYLLNVANSGQETRSTSR